MKTKNNNQKSKHLSEHERVTIQDLLARKYSMTEISKHLSRSLSTITRELKKTSK